MGGDGLRDAMRTALAGDQFFNDFQTGEVGQRVAANLCARVAEQVMADMAARLAEAQAAVERVKALRDEFAAEDHHTSTIISREIQGALDGER